MPAMDLCFTPASRLAALIRQRKVSPLEVTQAVLAQIERVNPKVNAYCTVAAKTALADARKATSAVTRRSARLGPLHGVPVSIKDLTPTRGIRTTWGSKIYEHHVPDEDALICGDDPRAKELSLELAGKLVAGRALDAGPLASARALEGLTAVIVNLNRRYKAHAGIRVTGVADHA